MSVIAIAELVKELRLRGIEFGKKTAHDGYVIRARYKGAAYNEHYGAAIYKVGRLRHRFDGPILRLRGHRYGL